MHARLRQEVCFEELARRASLDRLPRPFAQRHRFVQPRALRGRGLQQRRVVEPRRGIRVAQRPRAPLGARFLLRRPRRFAGPRAPTLQAIERAQARRDRLSIHQQRRARLRTDRVAVEQRAIPCAGSCAGGRAEAVGAPRRDEGLGHEPAQVAQHPRARVQSHREFADVSNIQNDIAAGVLRHRQRENLERLRRRHRLHEVRPRAPELMVIVDAVLASRLARRFEEVALQLPARAVVGEHHGHAHRNLQIPSRLHERAFRPQRRRHRRTRTAIDLRDDVHLHRHRLGDQPAALRVRLRNALIGHPHRPIGDAAQPDLPDDVRLLRPGRGIDAPHFFELRARAIERELRRSAARLPIVLKREPAHPHRLDVMHRQVESPRPRALDQRRFRRIQDVDERGRNHQVHPQTHHRLEHTIGHVGGHDLRVVRIVQFAAAAAVLPLGQQVLVIDEPAAILHARFARREDQRRRGPRQHLAPRRLAAGPEIQRIDAEPLLDERIQPEDRPARIAARDQQVLLPVRASPSSRGRHLVRFPLAAQFLDRRNRHVV
jgi:hypothetical protein